MNVSEALKIRKSVRAFTQQSVSEEDIRSILDVARCAPSGVNTQPWQVAVISGEAKKRLETRLETAFREGLPSAEEYQYYPAEWHEPYKSRRKACGLQLYSAVGIHKEDTKRRQEQWAANYRCFGAPVMMLFLMDAVMETGSYMDYGMFIQSVMLAAVEKGLATCPQAALAQYPQIVRDELGYNDGITVVCGIALGYEDISAAINQYRTPREDVDSFTRFFS